MDRSDDKVMFWNFSPEALHMYIISLTELCWDCAASSFHFFMLASNTLRRWTIRQLREHMARRLKPKAQVSDPRVKLYDPTILHERIRGQNWFQLCLAYMLVSPTTLIYCRHSTTWTLMFKGFAWFSTDRVLQECTGSNRLAMDS